MDPLTIGLLGFTAFNTFSQFNAAGALGEYQNRIGNLNAELSEARAEDAINRGDLEAGDYLAEARLAEGSQKAAAGTSGVDVNTGSFADQFADTRLQGARGALQIKNNAWAEAYGYKSQAIEQRAGAQFATVNARNTQTTGLLTGGFQAASAYANSPGYRKSIK